MSQIPSVTIERFRRLPRDGGERWQGGLVRLPGWVEEGPDGKPYRAWAGVWVSLTTGLIHLKVEPEPGAHDWTLALEALLEFGLGGALAGRRPGNLEVAGEELGTRLRDALGDRDLGLTVSRDLPAVRQVLARMSEEMAGTPLPPDALGAPGVTVDRMRAFARAAKRFYEAAPWRHLTDADLIHVEVPAAAPGLGHVTVLGAGGREFGLGFFESVDDYNELLEPALLAAGRDDEAGALLRQFEGDATALWEYGWALWRFRQGGDSRAARDSLRRAVRANRRVPNYLIGKKDLPEDDPPAYTLGSQEEAVICARALAGVWQATPGARQWLAAETPAGKRRGRRRR